MLLFASCAPSAMSFRHEPQGATTREVAAKFVKLKPTAVIAAIFKSPAALAELRAAASAQIVRPGVGRPRVAERSRANR
jgi:hypothetical protein